MSLDCISSYQAKPTGTGDGFFLACKNFGGRFDESFLVCTVFVCACVLIGDQVVHTSSTVQARISPQWFQQAEMSG